MLWEKFKESMSEDVWYQVQKYHSEINIEFNEDTYNEALIRLEDKSLAIINQTLVNSN